MRDYDELKLVSEWITNLPIPTRGATLQLIRLNDVITRIELAKAGTVTDYGTTAPPAGDLPNRTHANSAVVQFDTPPAGEMPADERLAFELWYHEAHGSSDYRRRSNGAYCNWEVQNNWKTWEARSQYHEHKAGADAVDAARWRKLVRLLDAAAEEGGEFPGAVHEAFQMGGGATCQAIDAAMQKEKP